MRKGNRLQQESATLPFISFAKKQILSREQMKAETFPSSPWPRKCQPKEEHSQAFRILLFSTRKYIFTGQSLFHTWHLKGGISHSCLKGNPFGNMGKAQSRADLWHHCRHYRKHEDQAGEMPQCSPEAAFQPVNKSCGLGILLWTQHAWTACPCRNLWQQFPVRDLGSGDTGFLLRHHDVTMRVGTGPRKTSSWTGSTLV